MAENSSKNLLDTRSHVLRSSTPAKRYPLMGTQHITHKERFPSVGASQLRDQKLKLERD